MRYALILFLALGACQAPELPLSLQRSASHLQGPRQFTPEWTRSAQILLGGRQLDEDIWSPVDSQGSLGVEIETHSTKLGLGWEVGVNGAIGFDDNTLNTGVDLQSSAFEGYGGLRYTLDLDRIHPYVGTGISVIRAEFEALNGFVSVSTEDASVAGYVHGGVKIDLGQQLNTGVDVRYLYGSDLELAGISADVDYFQVAWLFGFNF